MTPPDQADPGPPQEESSFAGAPPSAEWAPAPTKYRPTPTDRNGSAGEASGPGRVVAVVGPGSDLSVGRRAAHRGGGPLLATDERHAIAAELRARGFRPVVAGAMATASSDEVTGVAMAVAACDALIAVLPATVGLDPGTCVVWALAAELGVPRAAVVTALGGGGADFDDVGAIAARALGPECVPVRLPVWDEESPGDDPSASMSLVTGELMTIGGQMAPTLEHLDACAADRRRLLEALAVMDEHDEWPAEEMWVPLDRRPPGAADHFAALAASTARGEFAPLVPWTQDQAAASDVAALLGAVHGVTARLAPRDIDNRPCDAAGYIVMAAGADGGMALVRRLTPSPPGRSAGEALWVLPDDEWAMVSVTRSEAAHDALDRPDAWSPYRAWPTAVRLHPGSVEGLGQIESAMPLSVGDTIGPALARTWWVPVA